MHELSQVLESMCRLLTGRERRRQRPALNVLPMRRKSESLQPETDSEITEPMGQLVKLLGSEVGCEADVEHHPRGQQDDVLSAQILTCFNSLGILPIIGVNDPVLRDKLARPEAYGYSAERIITVSGGNAGGLRRWRLQPLKGEAAVGQSIIVTEGGDILLETVGPWGCNRMHRAADGTVTQCTVPPRVEREAQHKWPVVAELAS